MTKEKVPFYFSIDFEDFHYDTLRALNIKTHHQNPNAMIKSYKIKELSVKYFHNKKMTFFVTVVFS